MSVNDSMRRTRLVSILILSVLASAACAHGEWTHAAGDASRTASAAHAPRAVRRVRWTAPPQPDEQFVAQSSPVVALGRVFVNARQFNESVHVANRLIALDAASGQRIWSTPLPADVNDSWSSPAIGLRTQTVYMGVDDELFAMDAQSGAVLWSTDLERKVVNASPAVTTDLTVNGTPANRVFITDSSGFGGGATLYAINIDPNVPPHNPHRPGGIVWTVPLGRASGATPAYADGVVYVASGHGNLIAVDALNAPPDPNRLGAVLPLWKQQVALPNTSPDGGFFGGLSVWGDTLLAATFDFYGGQNAGTLVKVSAADGAAIWATPCERTDSIPIPAADGRLLLSGGIDGFGSAVKVQRFHDSGSSGSLTWETTNLLPAIGGWTHQPARSGDVLFAGAPNTDAGSFFGPYTDLFLIDMARDPNDAGFVLDSFSGAGGSPAIAYGRLYSIGTAGLVALEPTRGCLGDIDGDGSTDLDDLTTVLSAFGSVRGDPAFEPEADLDISGAIDLDDVTLLLGAFGGACPLG
jgi:outer membrane protein assembly factor BamB